LISNATSHDFDVPNKFVLRLSGKEAKYKVVWRKVIRWGPSASRGRAEAIDARAFRDAGQAVPARRYHLYLMSVMRRIADSCRTTRHFREGPHCEICTAAKKALLDHLVGGRLTGKTENK